MIYFSPFLRIFAEFRSQNFWCWIAMLVHVNSLIFCLVFRFKSNGITIQLTLATTKLCVLICLQLVWRFTSKTGVPRNSKCKKREKKNVFKDRRNFRRSIHSINKSDEVETYIVFSDCPTPSPTCPRWRPRAKRWGQWGQRGRLSSSKGRRPMPCLKTSFLFQLWDQVIKIRFDLTVRH